MLGAVPETPPIVTDVVGIVPATGNAGSVEVVEAVVPRAAAGARVAPLAGGNAGLGVVVAVSPKEAAKAGLVASAAAGPTLAPVEAPLPLVLGCKKKIGRKW